MIKGKTYRYDDEFKANGLVQNAGIHLFCSENRIFLQHVCLTTNIFVQSHLNVKNINI